MSSNYPLSSLRALTQYAKDAETSQSDALREYMYAMLLVTEFSVLQMKAAVRKKDCRYRPLDDPCRDAHSNGDLHP